MRNLAIFAAATIIVLTQAVSAQTSSQQPAPGTANTTTGRAITRTGETKPPGSPVPEGPNRIDELQKKSDRIGRQAEQSICKC